MANSSRLQEAQQGWLGEVGEVDVTALGVQGFRVLGL